MIKLQKASHRNTQAHWVTLGSVSILFSYETAVAFNSAHKKLRLDNHWGPTTGRHMNEAGVKNYQVVDDNVFTDELNKAIKEDKL